MDPLIDVRAEFWGNLQAEFYTTTSALYLANQELESVISTDGRKAHKPILSQPSIRDYVAHQDLTFDKKKAEKQTLEVDTFPTAAEVIDITERNQTPYDMLTQSSTAIRRGLINRVEQKFNENILDAAHVVNGGTYFKLDEDSILSTIEEADGTLGSFDIPMDTSMKVAVMGPRTIAAIRKNKLSRETPLGDTVFQNGVIGPWQGWTFVQNNNLPWSATFTLDTNPTAGDEIRIMSRKVEFVSDLTGADAGSVLIGANPAATRANLVALLSGGAGAGTTYVDFDIVSAFIIRNKRRIQATTAEAMAFTGFGDITVSEDMTAETNVWSNERQESIFMMRGAIDLVMQFMELEIGDKEKGFADLPKGIIGVGSKMFQDGALMSVRVPQNVSSWNS
jgi:hypothetical protein